MWSSSHQKRVAIALFLSFGIALSVLGQVQTGSDEWRRRPQALQPAGADKVSPGSRAAQDKFFDRVIGTHPPGVGVAWDKGPIFEEIPAYGFLTVAIVQFANFTTIRSASERSIYTEVTMNVEQVLKDPAATAQTGKTLTVALGGGTLRLPSGEIVQRNLDLGDYGIQPGHRYLAFLGYEKDGEYFSWLKSWDLSSGVAVPTYPFDIQKAKDGTSRFAGMPADNFVAAARGILSPGAR